MSGAFDDTSARAALDAVFAAPPFAGGTFGREGVWLRLWQLLERWYKATLSDMYLDSPVSFWLVMLVLSAVAGVLVWHLAISLRRVVRSVRGVGEIGDAAGVRVAPLSLADARAAIAGADYRFAVELAWRTVATSLVRRAGGIGGDTSARTPRQQARTWRRGLDAGAAAALDELVRAHEQACYSGGAPRSTVAQAALQAATALMETV